MATQCYVSKDPIIAIPRPGDVSYRVATSPDDLEQAFALVRDSYVSVGLHDARNAGLRLTRYHFLPGTIVFVALEKGRVIGTLSVVPDHVLGLPAEAVAEGDLSAKRRDGARMAEVIALAANARGTRERVVLKLFQLAYEHCRRCGISDMVASLTERHIGFYRRFLGFEPLGELREYKMANGLPVQVHLLTDVGCNPKIAVRSQYLMSDPAWEAFWYYDSHAVLKAAAAVNPMSPELQRYFISRCPTLEDELDDSTCTLLAEEYERYGSECVVG